MRKRNSSSKNADTNNQALPATPSLRQARDERLAEEAAPVLAAQHHDDDNDSHQGPPPKRSRKTAVTFDTDEGMSQIPHRSKGEKGNNQTLEKDRPGGAPTTVQMMRFKP